MSLESLTKLFEIKISSTQYFYYKGNGKNDAWIKAVTRRSNGEVNEAQYHVYRRESDVYLLDMNTAPFFHPKKLTSVKPEDITRQPLEIIRQGFSGTTLSLLNEFV